jgi:hypothetical protein
MRLNISTVIDVKNWAIKVSISLSTEKQHDRHAVGAGAPSPGRMLGVGGVIMLLIIRHNVKRT